MSSLSSTEQRALAALVALSAAAWAAILAWGASPHADLAGLDSAAALVPYVGAWTLMVVAMMLPTSAALLGLFARMVAPREDAAALVALAVAGYLGVWTAVGAALHAGDLGVHALVGEAAAWPIAAATLALAGAYQLSPLKAACLSKCRSPRLFLSSRWRGGDRRAAALRLGAAHGLWCVGCCWALMLVMFAVGVGNIAWMLILGALMAAEKNAGWGRGLSAPAGAALLGLGSLVALYGVAVA
ncbi:MAG TPA: DUF2182 domain-containing protein [Thermoleophilaceae bacterium]|nr:DUF2182 domain-containing protein [Thermoleophilaceae bacterium]